MIYTQDLLPKVYSKESRDFQLLCKAFDVVLNYVKCNTDLMRSFPINYQTDSKLLDLAVRTLGFFPKGSYSNEDLNKIANTFTEIIRNKGSLVSINILCKALLEPNDNIAEYQITLDTLYTSSGKEIPIVVINIPDFVYSPEVRLIEEVLDYILPIGCLYQIETSSYINADDVYTLETNSRVKVADAGQSQLGYYATTESTKIEQPEIVSTSGVVDTEITQGDIRVGTVAEKEKK